MRMLIIISTIHAVLNIRNPVHIHTYMYIYCNTLIDYLRSNDVYISTVINQVTGNSSQVNKSLRTFQNNIFMHPGFLENVPIEVMFSFGHGDNTRNFINVADYHLCLIYSENSSW